MIPPEMIAQMTRKRLVAEVRTDTARQALSVVDALAAGGITSVEVSLTIPGASEILSHLATRQDVTVGAGSVLDERQASEAISSGARFIASPIFNPEIIAPCRDANVACVLGALTPTEIIAAQKAGAEMVKLFPVEALGGPIYLRVLLRQLTHISVQVAGGFPLEHLPEYLALPVRTVAMGTLLTPTALVEQGAWQAITNRARVFVDYVANPAANGARLVAMVNGMAPAQAMNPAASGVGAANMGPNQSFPGYGAPAAQAYQPYPGAQQGAQGYYPNAQAQQHYPQSYPPQRSPMENMPTQYPQYPSPYAAGQQPPAHSPEQPPRPQPAPATVLHAPSLVQPPTLIISPADRPAEARDDVQDDEFGDDDYDEAEWEMNQRPAHRGRHRPPLSEPVEEFRPWDSRPIEQGDDEDWLR